MRKMPSMIIYYVYQKSFEKAKEREKERTVIAFDAIMKKHKYIMDNGFGSISRPLFFFAKRFGSVSSEPFS